MPGPSRNPSKPYSRAYRAAEGAPGVVQLPASGCDLPVPELPKGRAWSEQERETWESIWSSPMATQYDDTFIPAVAAYVVHASSIYGGNASAWQAAEFRHLGDKLGLTPAGLLALGWRIEGDS